MSWIVRSFFRGLLFIVPVAATAYVLWWLFVSLDSLFDEEKWLGFSAPGLGVAVALVAITLVGFLCSNFLTSWLVRLFERMLKKAPLASLIYSSIKDLLEAFVGEKKKFDRPVLVRLNDSGGEMLGFITRDDCEWLGRKESVAVYFPQSYNFAGNLVVFPRAAVTPVDADPSHVMQFIVSGGVSGV